MSRTPSLRVAVLGAGTVGWPVVRAFLERPESLAPFDGVPLDPRGRGRQVLERLVERGVPAAIVTDAPAHLVADPEVDVVVELMGGDEPARTLIAAALGAGKRVVTANKHVIAHHGAALEAIARENGGTLRFEASVGGGIPVLGPLAADLAANNVRQVRGIVNGTTNFILTSMREQGSAYAEALAEAQARGYAEANPRGDVEGDDAVNKVVILARLAFGAWLDPADIAKAPPTVRGTGRPGITGVTADEVSPRARWAWRFGSSRSPRSARTVVPAHGSSRAPSTGTIPSGAPTGSSTGSRSWRTPSGPWHSPAREPAATRRAARSWGTC